MANEVDKLTFLLEELEELKLSLEDICKLTEEQSKIYNELLSELKKYNEIAKSKSEFIPNINNKKGEALEKLVTYLLEISGGIFEVYENIKTETNQIDQFVKLNSKGKKLERFLPDNINKILVECKNHKGSVGVDYIGKFCSLMLTTDIRIGLFFTSDGVSGQDSWEHAGGLIRKFYLSKEDNEKRFKLLTFDINDLEKIASGENLLRMIEKKIESLQLNTSYIGLLSKHPIEERIKS